MITLIYNDENGNRQKRNFRNEKSLDVWTQENVASIIKITKKRDDKNEKT